VLCFGVDHLEHRLQCRDFLWDILIIRALGRRNFVMNRFGSLQRQAPWTPFVVASAALGLALYCLRTRHSPTASASKPSQVKAPQPCQASDADHKFNIMSDQDRAYHERFMREAIAMVNPFCFPSQVPLLTHHLNRLSLPSRAMKHLSVVSSSRTAKSLDAA